MRLRLKPYPAYKDSGVGWLQRVPRNWNTGPGLSVFQEKRVKNTGLVETEVLSLSYGKIVIKPQERLHGLVPGSFETYQIVDPSEIIIRPTDLQNDWTSLRVGIAKDRGIITSAYLCLTTKRPMLPEYGYLLLHSYDVMKVFYGMGSGLRQNLDFTDIKRMPVLIPPEEDQAGIVRYVGRADRRTNQLIRTKQQLIKLLNEQKQAIVNHAVTRGLDPNVRLKPSGVDWLGDVPEHWKLSRLKFLSSHIVDCLHATPQYIADGKYHAIRTADVEAGKVRINSARRISYDQYLVWTARLSPQEGDILYTREGERYGLAALVPPATELCISQRMMLFRIRKPQHSEYMMWQLNCPHVFAQASEDLIGATSPHVNVERIKNYVLLEPPVEEQQDIAAWIEVHLRTIDESLQKAKNEISLLREYRTRLIADVVTGKLDVRKAGTELIDEIEAFDTLTHEEALSLATDETVDVENIAELEE